MLYDLPAGLRNVEFARLYFHLEFQESFEITSWMLLRLRRGLRQASRAALAACGSVPPADSTRFERLFDPGLSTDPVSLKRFQRPGPSFVLQPSIESVENYEAGERFILPINLFGKGIQGIGDFATVFQVFGGNGLNLGEGKFELVAIEGEDPSGNRQPVWKEGDPFDGIAPPLIDARWWLERRGDENSRDGMKFLTPARLISRGKPLFRPSFGKIFPFVLRRVSSMLHAHCNVELDLEPQVVLKQAEAMPVNDNRLRWVDWRVLESEEGSLDLGGVGGSIHFAAALPDQLFAILELASLMNLGKAAAFGSGIFRLESA